ncbi:nickel-dependent hydrogenase large subunit [Marimonas arenosa]|uniref:Uptake hydrogenase large subunit n=1 Tax=Marimonas arenosa TaxID=1795305 RepID=A0AAE3WC63_9RHOB|nr:nickel-dependent hydrogenase large subunit [Marimonas arenosa]MDQ2089730.1 nickel-dependent hydrogenase large subunit [Marimonas arenosa]
MNKRLVVDPITRIEGHLRIEAQMQGNQIAEAYSSGTMVRGIEIILRGRDPRDAWAFAQRICGVCTLVHGIASVRSVEDALSIEIPKNAQLIRNLMIAAQYVHDHVMHFYHLHALDWVDVVSALDADPKATADLASSLSNYPKSSPGYFADVKTKLKTFVEQGQLGIFANGYWGHSAYKLPPEANLMAVAHYLDALEWQRDVVKLHTIFGGKNPHPNFLVGGVPCPVDPNSDGAITMEDLSEISRVITKMEDFVNQAYLPDTLAIASFYKDWGAIGEGVGNFLTYGDYPTGATNDVSSFLVPRGVILDRDLSTVHDIDLHAEDQIQEYVDHAWYKYQGGEGKGLHPYNGETEFDFTGPEPPYEQLNVDGGYSWLKSPRWKGKAMEVGPLSRMLMLYATGNDHAKELVDTTLRTLDVPVTALFSTLGRTAARTLETKVYLDWMRGWYNDLVANIKAGDLKTHNAERWDPSTWPARAQGAGYMEAPRGALGHWIVIEDQKIANYQAVVPTTWNAGPRDADGASGPYEAALKGHQLANPEQPLEILRTIHSFDPCIACAVHMVGEDGQDMLQVKVS